MKSKCGQTARIEIRIEPKIKAEAHRFAAREGRSLSQLIRVFLYGWVVQKRVEEEERDDES